MIYCDDNLHRAYGDHAIRAKAQGFTQVPFKWFADFHAAWMKELYAHR